MDQDLSDIRAQLTATAGGGLRLAPGLRKTRGIGLYATINLPGLDDMPAVRDTAARLASFGVPEDLAGKAVLDVGSNQGAFSFEFAKRGAKVAGVEYRQDRADVAARIRAVGVRGAVLPRGRDGRRSPRRRGTRRGTTWCGASASRSS